MSEDHDHSDDFQDFLSSHTKIGVNSALRKYHAEHLIPSNLEGLPSQDQLFDTRDILYRPKSACSVNLHNELPVTPDTVTKRYGKQTRSSILRAISRCESAKTICSNDSWIDDKKKLCRIYYYYNTNESSNNKSSEIGKHVYLTGGRYTSPKVVDSLQVTGRGVYVSKEDRSVAFEMQQNQQRQAKLKKETRNQRKLLGSTTCMERPKSSVGINTDHHYLSISNWHGADWQKNRPKMYGPPAKKYDPKISVPVRSKKITTKYLNMTEYAKKIVGVE